MKEEFKVNAIGDTVFAFAQAVYVYSEPSVTKRLQNLNYASDDPSWSKGDIIGKFEGTKQKIGSELWLKVKWIHKRRKVGLFNIRGQYTVDEKDGWVLDREVSKVSPLTIFAEETAARMAKEKAAAAEKAQKEADELKELFEGIGNDNKAPKATLGSTLGITKTNTDGTSTVNYFNITIYVSVLVAGIVVFLKFFKPKK